MIKWIKSLFNSEKDINIEDLETDEIWKVNIDKVRDRPELWKYNSVDLYWQSWENREIVGWRTTKPQEGDIFQSPMESGETAWFVFTNIKRCGDPHDMFFATVADLGYKQHASKHIDLIEPKMRLL